ncbi:MAG: cyclic nucleotide-binding domain-containing protein [Desulfobulbaceae bacterium]|nr:MAG: cyclic nucleotide-binding domain-containing protein [Desulfobulbaceae bacterium]
MEKNISQEPQKQSDFKQDFDVLRRTYLLSNLSTDCLKLFAMLSKRVVMVDDETLTDQGEVLDKAFYLISGLLEVLYQGENSSPEVIGVFEPGTFGGGASLLARMQSNFSLRAQGSCQLITIGRLEFEKIERKFPEIRQQMVANLVQELVRKDREMMVNDNESVDFASLPVSLI